MLYVLELYVARRTMASETNETKHRHRRLEVNLERVHVVQLNALRLAVGDHLRKTKERLATLSLGFLKQRLAVGLIARVRVVVLFLLYLVEVREYRLI